MVTFLLSIHTITDAKQYAGLGRAKPGRWIFQPGHYLARPGVAPPLSTQPNPTRGSTQPMNDTGSWALTHGLHKQEPVYIS